MCDCGRSGFLGAECATTVARGPEWVDKGEVGERCCCTSEASFLWPACAAWRASHASAPRRGALRAWNRRAARCALKPCNSCCRNYCKSDAGATARRSTLGPCFFGATLCGHAIVRARNRAHAGALCMGSDAIVAPFAVIAIVA